MKEFLKVENLCFGYLKQPLCLKDVNFSAGKKDRICIFGLDDKGKTSLIKTVSGFDLHFFGKVFIGGKEIKAIPDNERNVSLIFDEPIILNSTIENNIDYLYETLKREVPSKQEKEELLKKFNLEFDLKTKVKKLSIFQKFKLCFLRSFAKGSKVIFLDDILKHKFNDEEIEELKQIFDFWLNDKLVLFCANEKSFAENKSFFEWFNPTKVLYVNNAKVYENNSIDEFLKSFVDLDMCLFSNELEFVYGFCVYQDGEYYLSFNNESEIIVKIDKKLNEKFESLKLSNCDNEDIVLVYKKGLKIDLTKNNDINKMFFGGDLMVFSKLDRTRVL